MVRSICGLTLALLAFAGTASAQQSACGHVEGETYFFKGRAEELHQSMFDVPDDGPDAVYRLKYCIEVWDSAGGYIRWENLQGATFPVVNGVLGQDAWGDDDYEARDPSDPEQNPEGYPAYTDLLFYPVNDNEQNAGNEDYLSMEFWVTPYTVAPWNVRVTVRITASFVPD